MPIAKPILRLRSATDRSISQPSCAISCYQYQPTVDPEALQARHPCRALSDDLFPTKDARLHVAHGALRPKANAAEPQISACCDKWFACCSPAGCRATTKDARCEVVRARWASHRLRKGRELTFADAGLRFLNCRWFAEDSGPMLASSASRSKRAIEGFLQRQKDHFRVEDSDQRRPRYCQGRRILIRTRGQVP